MNKYTTKNKAGEDVRYLQRIQSTNVSVHEYIFAQQIFTWKTKQVFALEAWKKWKKTPLPSEQNSCPQHQLPEEIWGVFFPLHLLQARTWFLEQRNQRIKSEGCGDLFAICKLGLTSTLQNL